MFSGWSATLDRSLCGIPLTKYGVAQGQVIVRACQTGIERHDSSEHFDRGLELALSTVELAQLPQHICVVWRDFEGAVKQRGLFVEPALPPNCVRKLPKHARIFSPSSARARR
jgi:hypothetical protein